MINPERLLKLTPLNAQNPENILEIDAERIIGWLAFPEGTAIYLDIPNSHSMFSVKENVQFIKEQIAKINDSGR